MLYSSLKKREKDVDAVVMITTITDITSTIMSTIIAIVKMRAGMINVNVVINVNAVINVNVMKKITADANHTSWELFFQILFNKKRKKSDFGLLFCINEENALFAEESFEGVRDNQSLPRVFEWRDDRQSAQFLCQLYHKELWEGDEEI